MSTQESCLGLLLQGRIQDFGKAVQLCACVYICVCGAEAYSGVGAQGVRAPGAFNFQNDDFSSR